MSVAFAPETSQLPSFEARYDLPSEQVEYITEEFLSAQSVLPTTRFFCTEVDGGTDISNVARFVERSVFDASFENDDSVMKRLYGSYEHASTFFMVFDLKERRAVGTLRAISNSENGLMTLNEIPRYIGKTKAEIIERHGLDEHTLDSTWDVGTVAVLPNYRGLLASSLLYRAYALAGEALNVKKFLAIIAPRARRNLEQLGVPLATICDAAAFDYEGAQNSTAVTGDFQDFLPSIAEHAMLLREKARMNLGDLLRGRIKNIIYRKVAARIAGRLVTGRGLDESINLPLSMPRAFTST